jgi:NMD protein affecting ribosome stability and mRNA decay
VTTSTAPKTDPRQWTRIPGTKTRNTVRDEVCPSCAFPETAVVRSAATMKALRIGCVKCGYWRTAQQWAKKKKATK